jgi:hypothetical protein
MSLILEALNRSRDSSGAIPTLATQHPVESVRTDVRQYVPWVVLSVALLLIAWLLWSRLSGEPSPAPNTGSPVAELTQNIGSAATSITTELKARAEAREKELEPPVVKASQPATQQQTAAPAAKAPPEPVQAETGQSAPAGVAEAEPEAARRPVENAAVVPGPESVSPPATENPAVARLYRDRSVPEEAAPVKRAPTANREEQPVDIQDVFKRAQVEMGNNALDDHAVPFLSSLSQQTKNKIPTLYYHKHDYSSDAGKSRVTLNGKTVSVGGSPAPGFKVEEILPNSVVLEYRGTQFRLRALNSWINL